MFLFNDPVDVSDIELVHDRALPTETSMGIPLGFTVLLGIGGFALTANPIVGGALAALPAYALVKKLKKSWQNNTFERRNPGCVAHLIKTDADMIMWIEHHGVDDVRSQLLMAMRQRQRLTGCAKRTLKALVPEAEIPHKKVEQFLSAQTPAEETPSTVEENTQLNAIDVPSVTVLPARDSDATPDDTLLDTFINCPAQCRAILAGQRSGKTLSAAVATRILAGQGTWIGYINLQDHGQGNADAFAHAHRIVGNLASVGNSRQGQALVQDATTLIAEFYAQDDAILVVDEWMSLGAKTLQVEGLVTLWREIANKATALTSNGIGSGKGVWGLAPFFKAESLRDDAKCLKLFAPLILAIAPGQSFPWTNPKNGKLTHITYNQQVVNHAAINWSSTIKDPSPELSHEWRMSGHDRVYWWNGAWLPVGELPTLGSPPVEPQKELAKNHSENKQGDKQDEERNTLEKLYQETPNLPTAPAFELIQSVPDDAKREALLIAYKWATTRLEDRKDIDKQSFLARARSDRNCAYLRDHREEIWDELQGLLD